MTYLLLFVLIISEIGFSIFEITRKPTKKEWTTRRLILDAIELGTYLIMILLPGIDFSFRFKGLFLVLVLRIFFAGISALIHKKDGKAKKIPGIVISMLISIILIVTNIMPAFIFADYSGRPVTGKYSVATKQAILIDSSRVENFETDGSYREVPVHFYYPEDYNPDSTSDKNHTLPLVVFSHGAFGYYQSNASTYMELASNGYVVVSLDHPYHSFFTKDSDGKLITVNPKFISDVIRVQDNDDISEEELYELTSEWIELRIADMNFAVDTLEDAANGNMGDCWFFTTDSKEDITKVVELINTESIGLIGHSLGGATSVTVGRRDDIDAVIDLDGTMLGEETGVENGYPTFNKEPYTTPLLCIDNDSHHDEVENYMNADDSAIYVNSYVLKNGTDAYEINIEGTEHMNYTDLPLFSPFLAKNLGTGDVDAEECIDEMNAYVLKFFNCYLKDEGEWN